MALVGYALFGANAHAIIVDWMPLIPALTRQWTSNHLGVIFYACVLGLIASFAISFALTRRSGRDLPLVAIAALMSWAAFSAVRNMPLAAITCAVPLARHVGLLVARRKRAPRWRAACRPRWTSARAGRVAAGGLALVLALVLGLFSPRLARTPYPAGAVAFLQEHRLSGNVLGDFGWGQYLIWHLAPGSKVFIDGRYVTVFPTKVINDYLRFYFDWPGARRRAVRLSTRFRADSAERSRLCSDEPDAADGSWSIAIDDAVLFARAGTSLPAMERFQEDGPRRVQYFP